MPKKKHKPISHERFVELMNADAETVTDFYGNLVKMINRGDVVGSFNGALLDFLDEFKEDEERQMALAVIFLVGIRLGRRSAFKEKIFEPEKSKKKKSGNGQSKN